MTLHDDARVLRRRLTADPTVGFRDGQWEAIESLVERRARVLVVQRTGSGKSAVYFVATRLLCDADAGTTVLISPLLALMRNQLGHGRARRRAARSRSTRLEYQNCTIWNPNFAHPHGPDDAHPESLFSVSHA